MALFSNSSPAAAHVSAYPTMPFQGPFPFPTAMSTIASSHYPSSTFPDASAVVGALLDTSTSLPVNNSFFPAARATFSGSSSLLYASYAALFVLDNGSSNAIATSTGDDGPPSAKFYSLPQIILIALVVGFLSLMTVAGNFMVMISFKMDKQLRTISNYFLFSLAVADFAIGLISMPLNTMYLLVGYWPFGALMCDTWLALDYLTSIASVLNLLIISFDRYFSVTCPRTYHALRTNRIALIMISCPWIISLIAWPPLIYAWPYIEGKRTVEEHKCYIQFLKIHLYITYYTAIGAFYIPVTIMCFLYWQIWLETKKRQKDLHNLQTVKDISPQSTSSADVVEQEDTNKPSCSNSSAAATTAATDIETTSLPTDMCINNVLCYTCLKYCKTDPDLENMDEDSTRDPGHGSPSKTIPALVETSVQLSVSHCTSLTAITLAARTHVESMIPLLDRPASNCVRGPATPATPLDLDRGGDLQPTIQMIAEKEERCKKSQQFKRGRSEISAPPPLWWSA